RGMGCLVGVGAGSEREAQLIHLCYRPPGEPAEPRRRIALIGKGITFDAGGLNMKTGKGMEGMKADMAGAAAVLAVMKILPLLRPAAEVHAVVPAAENMPSGRALRPGDILTALDGTTVEVRNTDAEGRLVLADAIAYAVQLGADEILELSTLTGSCLVALGPYHAGVMCDDEALVQRFLAAAQLAGEKAWRLPLVRELLKEVEGEISDLKNGSSNRYGGAIQGGLFLEVFARKKLFLHLDIAGPATAEKETPLTRKGGTGYGVLALAEYLAPEPDGAG
ncbi:MAG: leucyl aminopeptidase, partial [Deltaproteobacteria bacterium]|nr:leucyl aminopeptidase [Deltaproteobacteria bacterium]